MKNHPLHCEVPAVDQRLLLPVETACLPFTPMARNLGNTCLIMEQGLSRSVFLLTHQSAVMLFPNRELKCCSCCVLMFLAVWIHFGNVSPGFLVKGTVLQDHISNRTKQDVKEGILTFKVPMFKAWFIKPSGTPLTKMGHGIEQAVMRFVRSTSVTLKVLKSHDSDVLWRVQLLSSATVHLRTCHHKR